MKFKTISEDEIENMSFDDLAYAILKEKGKKMKIDQIFKIICEVCKLSDNAFEEQIGDFFALLATEKRFIQLEKGYWDLRENHTTEINIEEDDDDIEEGQIENIEEETDEDDEYYDELSDPEDDKGEDDLNGLVIVDENYDDEVEL